MELTVEKEKTASEIWKDDIGDLWEPQHGEAAHIAKPGISELIIYDENNPDHAMIVCNGVCCKTEFQAELLSSVLKAVALSFHQDRDIFYKTIKILEK